MTDVTPDRGFTMTPDEFRRWGHEAVEWVARYMEGVEQRPVLSTVDPGWVQAQLPAGPPEDPEPWEAIFADLDRIVMPGITHWQHPSFFGYFQANASGPAMIGDLVSAGLGVQGMLWSTSPACTEVEIVMLDWLVDLCGLPDRFRSSGAGGGVIQDGASGATLCALLAARHVATSSGAALGDLVAYASSEAHSSIEKAVRVAGLQAGQLRLVPTDDGHRIDPVALAALMHEDRAAGRRPFLVTATVGTTSSHAIDPVRAIGEVTRRHGVWLHVDGAHAGAAAVVPELRFVNDGLELADSYCFDPHKWLFTNLECDAFFVADRRPLVEALSVLPEFLRNAATESGLVVDFRDWHLPLGRRFRALKLWFVLRHYGAAGLRHHVAAHVRWAHELADRLDADPRFELAAPVPLNLVCFRHVDGDEAGARLLDAVNASGRAFLTHTRLDGRYVLRVSVGQTSVERRHVLALHDLLDELA